MWGVERGACPGVPGYGYGVQELNVDYTLTGATLRQLSDRILAVTEDRLITYRDCGPTGASESVTVARTLIDASNTQSIDAVELRDTTRTLWVYDAFSDTDDDDTLIVKVMPDIADLHADGTGATRVFDKRFTWALDSSGKVVTATFDDGAVAKYRFLREVEDVATDVLYDLALPTGRRNVGAGVSIQADPAHSFAFTPNNVVGRHYWLGIGEEGAPPERKGYRYRLDALGTGSVEDELVDQSGNIQVVDLNQNSNWELFWFIDGQELVIQRTRTDFGGYGCSLEDDPFCVVYDHRRQIPLASDGARTYSLVFYRNDRGGVSESSWRNTYIGMYDYEPFDDSAASGKPTVAGKSSARQGSAIDPARRKELRERATHARALK
jgi:hypothetical protein